MDNKEAPGQSYDFDEPAMRTAYDHLYRLRQRAISTDSATEYNASNTEASQLEQLWLTGPATWALQWRYLDTAVENWANDPPSASGLLNHIFDDLERGHTEAARLERDSLLQADRLTSGSTDAVGTPHTSSLTYITTYTNGPTTDLTTHTSWWRAREWARERASGDADTTVDLTIAAHDLISGKRRLLTTATTIPATDVITELDRLTAVLGGARQRDGKEFVDELHYDILCDDYQAAMTAANHPTAEARRFEHKLCADDLRDQTLDFARNIGIQDAVETLANIDRTARETTRDHTTPQASWLDQITNHAERAREQITWHGIDAHYSLTDDSTRTIRAGRSPGESLEPWYGEELRWSQPGGEHVGEMHRIGRYATCEELLSALENYAAATPPAHSGQPVAAVPAEAATRLREFDQTLRELDNNLTTSTTIRAAIRSGSPVQLRTSGKRSNVNESAPSGERDSSPTPTVAGDNSRRHSGTHQAGIGTSAATPQSPADSAREAASKRRERMMRQPNRSRLHRRHL
ncbi:hypothetical protein [Nocardia sp. NPDC049149]|uniref:hypothetical protein n=1 Tax=Nocardia sp. NPDC049149 TaxID=3364315 RepID=UPI003720F414